MIIKQLFIDLDDTLWDTYQNNKDSLLELFDMLQWQRYFASFEEFFQIYLPHNLQVWHEYRQGIIDKPTLIFERFRRPFEGILELEKKDVLKWNETFLALTGTKTRLCPHALETLEYLHRYYKVCILSNGFREVQTAKLVNSGLVPFVHRSILSEDAGINKPHKAIFDFALARTGSRRSESIMIGDSWEADIEGAYNAKMPAIWYNPHQLPVPADTAASARHTISSLLELKEIL